jgi:hypothetical protein
MVAHPTADRRCLHWSSRSRKANDLCEQAILNTHVALHDLTLEVSCESRFVGARLAADQLLEHGLVADWIEVGVLFRHLATALPHLDRMA